MFERIDKFLQRTIRKYGIGEQVQAAQVCNAYNETIRKLKGKTSLKKTKPLYFRNETLTIHCATSSWAQELQMDEQNIINLVNKKLGKNLVERIRFRV